MWDAGGIRTLPILRAFDLLQDLLSQRLLYYQILHELFPESAWVSDSFQTFEAIQLPWRWDQARQDQVLKMILWRSVIQLALLCPMRK
jgi:hypothetical protein